LLCQTIFVQFLGYGTREHSALVYQNALYKYVFLDTLLRQINQGFFADVVFCFSIHFDSRCMCNCVYISSEVA